VSVTNVPVVNNALIVAQTPGMMQVASLPAPLVYYRGLLTRLTVVSVLSALSSIPGSSVLCGNVGGALSALGHGRVLCGNVRVSSKSHRRHTYLTHSLAGRRVWWR
jgi:hypothetical protein